MCVIKLAEKQNKIELGSSSKHIVAKKTASMLTVNDDIGWTHINDFVTKIKALT